MRKPVVAAFVAALMLVGFIVFTRADRKTVDSAPRSTTTLPPVEDLVETLPSVPYDPETGVIGTIPSVDPNADEGILSSGGT